MKESDLHKMIVEALQFTRPGVMWWHTPNEGKRKKHTGQALKRMGMKAGVSDFLFLVPPAGRLFALEVKSDGEKPTPDQVVFLAGVKSAGGDSAWTADWDVALHYLRTWRVT